MKTWLTFIALFLAFQAAGYWLSQPSSGPRPVTKESSQPAGEPSIDELITKYVTYTNQRDLDQYLALLHPEDQAALEHIEQKFSGWKKSNDVIFNYSFAHAPISDFRLHLLDDSFVLTTLPTHAVRLRCQSQRGPASTNIYVAEQNGLWYLVHPSQRKRQSKVDSSKEEFIYHFEPIEDNQQNWELSFQSSNSNDFQLVVAGDPDHPLMSSCELYNDPYGRKQLRVHFDERCENTEENSLRFRCSFRSGRVTRNKSVMLKGDKLLAFRPFENPIRSGNELCLAEISVQRNGEPQTHRLVVRETLPSPSEPRTTFALSDGR